MRLRVEALESRDNPAGPNMWLGGLPGHSGDFADPYNWGLGRTPISSDRILFDGVSGGTANCVFPTTSSPAAYTGLEFRNGYTSTVTLSSPIFFTTVFMHCGNVLQSSGATLSITNLIEWTAGNLHTGSTGEFIYLMPGAEGIASPANGGTVGLGSTFTLLGGSTLGSLLNMYEGTFNINGGGGFVVEDHSLVNFYAPVKITPTVIKIDDVRENPDENGQLTVNQGATAIIKLGSPPPGGGIPGTVVFEGETPKLTNKGLVEIEYDANIRFTPKEGSTGAGGGLIQDGKSAVTRMEAGCEIQCDDKTSIVIEKGALELAQKTGVTSPITIKAPNATEGLFIDDDAILKRSAGPTKPVTLAIEGSLVSGGTVELYAHRDENKNDHIETTGRVQLLTSSKFRVQWFDPYSNIIKLGVGHEWEKLIWSTYVDPLGVIQPITNSSTFLQPDPDCGIGLTPRLRNNNSELRVERTL